MTEPTPRHPPDWPKLICTRCSGDVWVELIDEGSSWQSYRVVDCISCSKCGAEWDQGGEPQGVEWLADLEETEQRTRRSMSEDRYDGRVEDLIDERDKLVEFVRRVYKHPYLIRNETLNGAPLHIEAQALLEEIDNEQ